ncbi:uncharacterized protein LOC117514662 [Thalassophryne amazonica]|uniref:uncharacterized protein LOC117514662 n=1 Tax=Thalassophryne amazonica TaxID=390379 RepID=UPI0014708B5F|nr:uncharacterized protein LOC117514662 [Thalassophryne amazonica]
MESYSYILFKANKRVTLKEDDMTTEKVGRIFQVNSTTVYLTDDTNVAIFPNQDGYFSSNCLVERSHYEVHGECTEAPVAGTPDSSLQPHRFSFHWPSSVAASSVSTNRASGRTLIAKGFQRSIYIADLADGKLETSQTLTVRFSEFEATVDGILSKVKEAFQTEDTIVLTDGQGNKIVDSEGTRGSSYWKQSAKKVFALKESLFQQLQGRKRRRLSRADETGLSETLDKIEEVVLAAQGLQDVITTIKSLTELAHSNRMLTVTLTEAQAAAVKAAFTCVICRGTVDDPMVTSCCNSIVACRICLEQWKNNSEFCPKCQASGIDVNMQRLIGLSEVFTALQKILE